MTRGREPEPRPSRPTAKHRSREAADVTNATDFSPENIPVGEFPFPVGSTVRLGLGLLCAVVDRDGFVFLACCTDHERAGTASGWHPQRDKGRILGEHAATDYPELVNCGRDAKVVPLEESDVGTVLDCGCEVERGSVPCGYHADAYGVAQADCGDCEFGVPLVYHECR